MGLDIYLSPIERHYQSERHEAEWEANYARKESGEIAEAEYDEASATITPYPDHEDRPSEKYPDHLFNRRYLRSSYNGSGFNHAVPDFLSSAVAGEYPESRGSLYWIFEPMGREWDGDDGILTADDIPKLEESKDRALLVAAELRTCDPLRAEKIMGPMVGAADHLWQRLPTEDEALAWFRDEMAKNAERKSAFGGDGYSTAKGTVFGFQSGIDVLAVTAGRHVFSGAPPEPIIIYRATDGIESYVQSAEITAEFCDEAIDLIKRDGSAHMMWSG